VESRRFKMTPQEAAQQWDERHADGHSTVSAFYRAEAESIVQQIRDWIASGIGARAYGGKQVGYEEGWDDALDIAEQIARGEAA
jgi:hypothetical protein